MKEGDVVRKLEGRDHLGDEVTDTWVDPKFSGLTL